MYGKLNERKLHESDYILSCERARQQLSDYLNDEAKRVNVDSAKKRAVVQHMDYEGFRQMVLGANIFPTKSKEIYNFSKGETPVEGNQIREQEDEKQKIKKRQQKMLFEKVQGKSQMHCDSYRQFKKKFNEKYSKQQDQTKTLYCYNLIKQQNQQRLGKIFNTDCEANILVKIVSIFQRVLNQMNRNETKGIEQQAKFMLMFFKTLLSIPTMKSISMLILSKKEKETISNFICSLKTKLIDEQEQLEIQKCKQTILN